MGLGLILIAISTSLVGLGGLGYFIYQELLSSSKRELEVLATAKSDQIESKVATAKRSVDAVAVRAAAFPKQRNAAMYQKLLVESLQNSEPSAAMGIFANGNLLIPNSKSFVTYILKEQSGLSPEPKGQKLPAPNEALLSATPTDIQKLPWYKSALEGKSAWTSPYNFLGQNIVTYSAAISENNKAVAVVSSDIVVRSLIPEVGAGEDKIGFVVIGAGGKLIASSDSFQAAQAQNPAIAEALNSLTQQSTGQPTGITQTAGNLWAYRQIEGSDWLVATYVPEMEIISKLAIPVGAAAIGISAILVIAILSFTNSLKKRLQPIAEECERFLVQQGNSSTATGKDDIENLSLSLKTTLQQVKSNEIRLRNELTQFSTADNSSVQSQQQMQQSFAENELIEAEVGDLLDVVSSMEEGDLTIEAQVNDRATGLVADTLNRLREKLVEIISSVLGTAQQVARGASDLEELARTVVLNTAEQAQSVAQGQALTEQVAMIAQRSASQVGVANRSLQEVRETVASGQTAIDTLTESISVLQSGSAQIVQRIKTLGEFVGLAEQFVQDQGQIASLTQVLALNATLVAARAAEQKDPKQFASVAREFESIAGQVNELATQTNDGLTVLQQRTSQIQTVVTAIDSEVQNLSGLVSGFTTGVESSQAAFQNIQVVTEGVVQIGQTITESSTEIAEAAGSTATYISEIAQLAERTAVLTRSARQQAEEMGNQAQQLLQGIQFFRLPENNSAFSSATATLPMTDMNLAMDEQMSQPEAIAPSVDYSDASDNAVSESTEDGIDLNLGLIAVPALAVATATTLNTFQQSDEIPESSLSDMTEEIVTDDEIDDSDLDDYLLEPVYEEIEDSSAASVDRSIDYVFNSRTDLATQDDQLLSFMDDLESLDEIDQESEQIYVFDDQAEMQEIAIEEISQTQDDTYSGITDITMIEESLFADLKQEIYQGNSEQDTEEYLDELDDLNVPQEDNTSLITQLDGVDETAISEAAVDPMILSATNSFLEDTAFGTPSALSEETLANLPTYVDFNIPDLDSDNDFEIPRNLIESTLDDSNSFFDASFAASSQQVEQVGIESAFDDPSESDSLEPEQYVIDEEMFTPSSADTDQDISISEQLVSREFEDYNDYVKDEALNESLYDAFSDVSNEVFNNSFGASFDESPFDRAFDEAINDYQTDPFGVMSEDLPEDATLELAEELVAENSDEFAFNPAFDQYPEEDIETALDSTFDIPPQQSELIDDGLMGAYSEEIAEVSLVEANEPELSTLDSDTAFPSLFAKNSSDEDFESAFDMSFDQDQSEEIVEMDQELDSIWSSETGNLELLDSEQERSPVDDFAMPDFSVTEDESVLADMPDAFEAIATEDTLTDEMFSFDLSEEPDAPADESVFEMDLSEESDALADEPVFEMDLSVEPQEELGTNESPNLFDDELTDSLNFSADTPDILETAQDDIFVEQNSDQIEDAEMDLVVFEQISESEASDSADDLYGIDSYSPTDNLTDDFEESAIFSIATEDLSAEPEYLSESPENIIDDLNIDSLSEINPLEEISSEADLALPELSDNWLDETVAEGEADEIFEDLLIDYPSLDQPSLESSQDYSIGFADELLDSLMNEADSGNDFLMDMPDNLPDLSDESVNTVYADPFASPVETDSEESEFEFDFSAFENLDANDSQDKPSKAIVDARSEIDSFLLETFPDLEEETSDKKKLGSEE